MTHNELKLLSARLYQANRQDVPSILAEFSAGASGDWRKYGLRLANFADADYQGKLPYQVIVKGNSKLPFYAFSALPLVSCPGAGACAKWCYSLKAWRTPGAYYRQLQNTLLLRHAPERVAEAFQSIPQGATFRLYVDGDFDTSATMGFWFALLFSRSDIKAYGYSKSWGLFMSHHKADSPFPSNYTLNLSSGGNMDTFLPLMKALPCVRGEFVAVPIKLDKKLPNAIKYSSAEYKTKTRAAAKAQGMDKVFLCPGNCGTCTKFGHACGSARFANIPIVIGIH